MDRKSNSLSLLAPPTDDDPSPRPPPTPQIFRYLQPSRPQFRPAPDEPFKGPKPPLGPPKIVFSKLASESFDPSPSRSAKQQQAAEQRSDFVPKEYVDKPPVIVPFSQLPRKPPDQSPLSRVFIQCSRRKNERQRAAELECFVESQFLMKKDQLSEILQDDHDRSLRPPHLFISTKPSQLNSFMAWSNPSSPMNQDNLKTGPKPRRNTSSASIRASSEQKKEQSPSLFKSRALKVRNKVIEKNKRLFEIKRNPPAAAGAGTGAGAGLSTQPLRPPSRTELEKGVKSGQKLLRKKEERKIVMTHVPAILKPQTHTRTASMDSAANSSVSGLNSPHGCAEGKRKPSFPVRVKLRAMAPEQQQKNRGSSPQPQPQTQQPKLKLPSKSSGVRPQQQFFLRQKQASNTIKKRKIIQISSSSGGGGLRKDRATSPAAVPRKPSLSRKKKSSKKKASEVGIGISRNTPELLETEPKASIGELSYNFEEDLMRLNSEIDGNSHKFEFETRGRLESLTPSPVPPDQEEEVKQSTFARAKQIEETESNPQSAKGLEFPRRFEMREQSSLEILSLIPEHRCNSDVLSGSPVQSADKKHRSPPKREMGILQKVSSSDSNSSKLTASKLARRLSKRHTRNSLSSFPSQLTQKGLIQTPEGSDNGMASDNSLKKKPVKRMSCDSLLHSGGTMLGDSQLLTYSSGSEGGGEHRAPAPKQTEQLQLQQQASWRPETLSARMEQAFSSWQARESSKMKSCPSRAE